MVLIRTPDWGRSATVENGDPFPRKWGKEELPVPSRILIGWAGAKYASVRDI